MSESGFEGYTPNESIVLPEGPISRQRMSDVCQSIIDSERRLHLQTTDYDVTVNLVDPNSVRDYAVHTAGNLFLEAALPDDTWTKVKNSLRLARSLIGGMKAKAIGDLMPESVELTTETRAELKNKLEKIIEGDPYQPIQISEFPGANYDEEFEDEDEIETDDEEPINEKPINEKRIARQEGVDRVLNILNGRN
jgi:hypothetical protein